VIPVIDVFAGPGGLNEGFSAYNAGLAFSTVASIEMDPIACETLRLRAAVRRAKRLEGVLPSPYFEFIAQRLSFQDLIRSATFAPHWKAAVEEVHQHELSEATRRASDRLIAEALGDTIKRDAPWVLIGGPPCQAYSLVGRSRRKHDAHFQEDETHTL
jgi:DNA (cytosine-5)-methyltransferase 1